MSTNPQHDAFLSVIGKQHEVGTPKLFLVLTSDALKVSNSEEVDSVIATHKVTISLSKISEMTVHASALEQLLVSVVDQGALLVFFDGLLQLLAGDNLEGTSGLLVHHPHEEVSVLVVIHGLVNLEIQEDLT